MKICLFHAQRFKLACMDAGYNRFTRKGDSGKVETHWQREIDTSIERRGRITSTPPAALLIAVAFFADVKGPLADVLSS